MLGRPTTRTSTRARIKIAKRASTRARSHFDETNHLGAFGIQSLKRFRSVTSRKFENEHRSAKGVGEWMGGQLSPWAVATSTGTKHKQVRRVFSYPRTPLTLSSRDCTQRNVPLLSRHYGGRAYALKDTRTGNELGKKRKKPSFRSLPLHTLSSLRSKPSVNLYLYGTKTAQTRSVDNFVQSLFSLVP